MGLPRAHSNTDCPVATLGTRCSLSSPCGLVAQGIEQRFPKPCVGSSNLSGATNYSYSNLAKTERLDSRARANWQQQWQQPGSSELPPGLVPRYCKR
jgi:hypothetical protein